MENSYRYFCNTACKYYPCHTGIEEFNCLFCFCPFYISERCPGAPVFLNKEGRIIKDCSGCTYPHIPENYDVIMKWVSHSIKNREYSEEIRAKAIPYEQRLHARDRKSED